MLRIRADLVDEIVAHARGTIRTRRAASSPGPPGPTGRTGFIRMLNAERSPTFYQFDSGDQLRLYRDMDARDEEPVVVYHSHTATEAYPCAPTSPTPASRRRTTCWCPPASRTTHEFRSFRIVDGAVTEERTLAEFAWRVRVETYMFAHTGADDVPDND